MVLLIGIGMSPWVELLLPASILALSLDVLLAAAALISRAPRVPRTRAAYWPEGGQPASVRDDDVLISEHR